jgi:hypothetical protein
MNDTSPFSSKKSAGRKPLAGNQSIGSLDASYRHNKTEPEHVRHIAVRDSGSGYRSDEQPVNAFMVPSAYLAPDASKNVPPKRPLGQPAAIRKQAPKQTTDKVKMYSEVATFGQMNRIRRPRMAIPVSSDASGVTEPWADRFKRYAKLMAALVIAGLLFVGDKLQVVGHFIAQKFPAIHFGHPRTSYNMMRGARLKRFGVADTWFRIMAPMAVVLLFVAIALFNGLVGDNGNIPGTDGDTGANQGSTVLQVTPSGSSNGNTGSAPTGTGSSPQTGTQPGQAGSSSSGALQSSGGSGLGSMSSPAGGFGGGSVTPAASTGSGSVSPPSTTPPTNGGSGGGSGSGGSIVPILPVDPPTLPVVTPPTDCLCQTLQDASKDAPAAVDGLVSTL